MLKVSRVKTKITEIVMEVYNERIIYAASGNDNEQNDLELEILYTLYTNIRNLECVHTKVSDDIFSTWVIIRLHHILVDMRDDFLDNANIISTYDKLANEILLRSFID